MITLRLNDAAARLVGAPQGMLGLAPPDALPAGLEERLRRGIARRGAVLVWDGSTSDAGAAPGRHQQDLTGWECFESSFHIEDDVAVDVVRVDSAPLITAEDQARLLRHGLAFALRFGGLVQALEPPDPVRCILGANETGATFRFHRIRPGEFWADPDLDAYLPSPMIEVDITPHRSCAESASLGR